MSLRRSLTFHAGSTVLPAILYGPPLVALLVGIAGSGLTYLEGRGALFAEYWFNTILSSVIAALVAVFAGSSAAWLMQNYRIPGKKILGVVLLLPLAIPPYLSTYTLCGFFDIDGPLSVALRQLRISETFFVNLSGPAVLGLILGFQLFPYVYLLVVPALRGSLSTPLDAARSLGKAGFSLFWRPGLGLLRPFAAAGAALVVMESLNEYGAASRLGVPTVTHAVFRAWHHAYDLGSALFLGLGLCVFAVLLVWLERKQRGQKRFGQGTQSRNIPREPQKLSALKTIGAGAWVWALLLPGLIVPVFQMLWWLGIFEQPGLPIVAWSALNTLLLSFGVMCVAVFLALAGLLISKNLGSRVSIKSGQLLSLSSSAAYGVPGVVTGLAVLMCFSFFDPALALGSVIALCWALVLRFFSIAHSGLSAAWEHNVSRFQDAAGLFGHSFVQRIRMVYLPLLRPALLSASLLVFLDTSKELTATLLLRPIGFSTLPTMIYEQANQELPHLAAAPGLVLLAITAGCCVLLFTLAKAGKNMKEYRS